MSFLTWFPATATVEALDNLEVIKWNQEGLHAFLKNEPILKENMQEVFNHALIDKLKYLQP